MLARLVLLLAVALCCAEDARREARGDSYLDAYDSSHGGGAPTGPDFTGPSLLDSPSGPSPSYGEPPRRPPYGGPRAPVPGFHGPRGPGGPSPLYGIGPVEPPFGPLDPEYGAPHSAPGHSLLDLDLSTVCKILLKVFIFKLIIKFIAIICLLLFLPKLKEHKTENSNNCNSGGGSQDDRSLARSGEVLDALTALVWTGVDSNSTRYGEDCQHDLRCRLRRVADSVDSQVNFPRIFSLFLHERLSDEDSPRQHVQTASSEKDSMLPDLTHNV